jgi:hypothetical protein
LRWVMSFLPPPRSPPWRISSFLDFRGRKLWFWGQQSLLPTKWRQFNWVWLF